MSDNLVIKINDDADKIKIDVDKIDVDKIFIFNDIGDKPHNGEPITMIEISPNEKYLITYSKEDSSIAGWNVKDIDKPQLEFDQTVKINEAEIKSLCVSDNKKLVYIDYYCNYSSGK
jgi:WD40 repeat protein